MSDFKGSIRSIYDASKSASRDKTGALTRLQQYHVVAVHGLGQTVRHDTAWTELQPNDEKSCCCWLSDLLPQHSRCVRVSRFDYSCTSLGKGISVADVKHLARNLLEKLLKEGVHNEPHRIVFIGHDFGGLVIKQALSLALSMHQYRHIAAMTSLLVFFATPHRARSSKSIASWMLFVAGQDRAYKVSWFSETAHMVETINAAFSRFRAIYKTMSIYGTSRAAIKSGRGRRQGLDESSATMGVPTETKIYRDEIHDKISIFDSGEDPTFQAICQELNWSKSPDFAFVDCLEYLAGFLRAGEIGTRRPGVFEDSFTRLHELDQLQKDNEYQDWIGSESGCLFVQGDMSVDNVIQRMQGKQCIIGGNLKPRCHTMLNSTQLPALLCHQLLCLEPGLFRHVQRLMEHLCTESVSWPDKIWILLRSLLSCPTSSARVCCIQEAVGTTASSEQSALRRLFALGADTELPFKLLVISPSAREMTTQLGASARLLELGPKQENFEPTLRFALDTLITVRPENTNSRDQIDFALNARYHELSQIIKEKWEASILDLVHSWTAVIVLEGSPATRRSVRLSASKLTSSLYDMYMRVLERSEASPNGPRVLRTLFWSSHAFRPLNVQELGVVTALDLSSTVITDLMDQIPLNLSWDISSSFCPLAYIADDHTMVVQDSFANFLAEPHYGPCKKDCLFCENNHVTMALRCLQYISLIDEVEYFKSQLQLNDDETENPWCFLEYAVTYWPEHYKLAKKAVAADCNEVEVLPGFEKYFNDKSLVRKWAHLYCAIPHPLKAAVWVDPIFVAVETGCLDLVKTMLKYPDSTKTNILTTALEIAIGNGNEDLICLFSKSGAKTANALHLAALSGRLTMRPLLLQAWDALSRTDGDLSPLHFACKSGHIEMVSELLERGADINAKARETGSITPLHVACQYGHRQVISLLLKRGAHVNTKDEDDRTPLHVASLWQQSLAVSALLECPLTEGTAIDVTAVDKLRATALHFAASAGRLDIFQQIINYLEDTANNLLLSDKTTVRTLLSAQDAHGLTPLHCAAAQGHEDIVRELILLESRYLCSHKLEFDKDGNYPIHPAVMSGHLEIVKLLLEKKESAEDQLTQGGKDGACPIHLAILHGHIDLVQKLCEIHKEAGVSLSLFYGTESQSPLHLAVDNCQVDMVKHLLYAEATPNIMDATQATPLHYACRKGFLHIVDLLLEYKASIDTLDEKDISPLLVAAEHNHEQVVKRLIDRGADVNAKDSSGNTALMSACKYNNSHVVQWLLEAGAKLNDVDRQGRRALHRAAEYASANVLQILLEHDESIDPDCKDNEGNTPLLLLVQTESRNQVTAISMFLEKGARPDIGNSMGTTPLECAKTAEIAIKLANVVDFTQSHESNALQQRLLQLSADKGYLEVIQHQHNRFAVDLSFKNDQGETLYHLSARSGHLGVVQYLISKSVGGYDEQDIHKRTPAWYAAEYGHYAVFKALGDAASGTLNQPDEEWNTPLSNAVKQRHFDIVKYLLENRKRFSIFWEQDDSDNKANRTLYHLAANQSDGSVDMIELLLKYDVPGSAWEIENGMLPLTYASINGNLNIVKALRRDAFGSLNHVDKDGKTALYHAVEGRHKDSVEYFVKEKVDLELPECQSGWTALHLAASSGQNDVVSILVSNGAALDVQDKKLQTPLFLAAYNGHENIVSTLLSEKCNVDLADYQGWTPLIAAYDNCGILERLIAAGANIHTQANDGFTALLGAAAYHEDSVRLLLSHGANALDEDDEKWTPLHFAVNTSNPSIINLLLEEFNNMGISPDMENIEGNTPLMAAFDQGSFSAAETLLKSGQFDINKMKEGGLSVATLATRRGINFVELLLDHGGQVLNQQHLEQVLVWVTEQKYRRLQSKCIALALEHAPPPLQISSMDKLLQLAVELDDKPLVRFLCQCKQSSEHRDKYNWTLDQINASFQPPDSQSTLDEIQLPPTKWDLEHKASDLILGEDQLIVHRDEKGWREITVVRANNPVRLGEKFYFEVKIITCVTDCLGIGFCRKNCHLYRMPGWENDTWGLHADDGGLFHASGWPKEVNEDWTYTSGDVVGCCIDFVRRKAVFTKNGVFLGICFTKITGRVFPMVALGVGDKVVANFGNTEDVPFRYPSGKDWEYTNEIEIESENSYSRDGDE